MYTIYALVDPIEDYKVCYVGMSNDILERYIQHLRCSDKNPAKNEWVRDLRDQGYLPTLRTLEVVETEIEAKKREAYWIHFYKTLHMPLTNTHIPPVSTKGKEYTFHNALSVPNREQRISKQVEIVTVLKQNPNISVRKLAKAVGCATATADKWKKRIRNGETTYPVIATGGN